MQKPTDNVAPRLDLASLRGRRVVIWGTGREGRAALRVLSALELAALDVIDDSPTPAELPDPTVRVRVGQDALAVLTSADVVVRSPGVGQTHPWLVEARRQGVTVTGGTALWMADHADRTVGITGTKGKSTTSSLISHLLTAVGRPNVLAGNIGVPVLDLDEAPQYVIELSAYQCADLTRSPRVVALTSLYPEHLDWSGGESEYYRDKLNVVLHDPGWVVANAADRRLLAAITQVGGAPPNCLVNRPDGVHLRPDGSGTTQVCLGPTVLFGRDRLRLLGTHNESNLCIALGALGCTGVDLVAERDAIAEALDTFEPLDFRLTLIEDPSGVLFVDDTLATIPEATIGAIAAFPGRQLTLIVGGFDRGVSYDGLRDYLAEHCAGATVIGLPDSGPRILRALRGIAGLTLVEAADMSEAVRVARERTAPGGVVLMSPGAPSYGHFDNFEHRSRVFRHLVAASRPDASGVSPVEQH